METQDNVQATSRPSTGHPDRLFHALLALLLLGAGAWYLWVQVTQFRALEVYLADVGSFVSVIAGPVHGAGLQTPVAWRVEGANYFGIHFQPALLALTPLFLVANHSLTFLVALTLAAVGAAWPLAIWARRETGSRALGLGFAALYLGNHFALSMQLANHPESLAMPGFFCAFLALRARRPVLYGLAVLWVLMVKEDFALAMFLFGGALLAQRDRRELWPWAAATMGGTVIWGAFAVAMMAACGHAEMAAAGATASARFASMGDSVPEIALYALTHPGVVAARFFSWPLVLLYLSVLALPLVDWRTAWLPALGAAPVLICDDALLRTLPYYYSYLALPFLFYGAVRGAAVLKARFPGRPALVAKGFAAALLAAGAVQSALPTRTDGRRHVPFEVTERDRLVPEIVTLIPADATVAVQYDLFPQVPPREVLLPMRLAYVDQVEYILMNQRRFPSDLADKGDEFQQMVARINALDFEVAFEAEGFVLLQRGDWDGVSK
ncbi:MAG: DUF2079 domain-containing protein [Sumerlaeia bacterium]